MHPEKTSINISAAASQNIKERDYWLQKLQDPPEASRFPYYHEQGYSVLASQPTTPLKTREFSFSPSLSARLLKISSSSAPLLFVVLTAALAALIHKYTGQKDIILGTSIIKQEFRHQLINEVLALRNILQDDMTFKKLILQVKETFQAAVENQDYPFETILFKLGIPSSNVAPALFETIILLESLHDKSYILHTHPTMIFSFRLHNNQVGGDLDYHPTLYSDHSIESILGHLTHLLDQVLADVNISLPRWDILSAAEKEQLVVEFNNTTAAYPGDKTLPRLFEEQVNKNSDTIALVGTETCCFLSYQTLNQSAQQLAVQLQHRGIVPDSIVGLLVDQPIGMVIAMLAILRAGGAYLPLDPTYPGERIKYILLDSRPQLLLVNTSCAQIQADALKSITPANIISLQDDSRYFPQNGPPVINVAPVTPVIRPEHLAYILYTSGTTGKPKGVMITHRNAVNLLTWYSNTYRLAKGKHVLQLTNYTFDPSVEDIFGTLLYGATLYIGSKDLAADREQFAPFVERHQIHLVDFVPTLLKELLGVRQPNSSLETVISGGEVLPQDVKDKIIAAGYRLYNHYGPTETTVDAIVDVCSAAPVSIGRPIANTACYILDSFFNPVPIGISGELFIGGTGVGRGYINNPILTGQKFIKNPFRPAERIYRTGDLARWLENGKIQFIGRNDHQVKIRGHRIELLEIENCLNKYPYIKEAILTAHPNDTGETCLYAYYIPKSPLPLLGLEEYLANYLPSYMIPRYAIPMEKFPLTPNGKVERKSLPVPNIESRSRYIAPRNKLENQMAVIWADVLKVKETDIGIESNFFDLGGHSLRAAILISKLHKAFNVLIPLAELFMAPTIKGLFQYIQESRQLKHNNIEPTEEREYYALSSAQNRMYILQQMELQSIAYNMPVIVPLAEALDVDRLEITFKRLIQRHESLRTSFHMTGDQPVQKIHDEVKFEIEYKDSSTDYTFFTDEKENIFPHSAFVMQRIQHFIRSFIRPFDLSMPPLLRAGLIKSGQTHSTLLVDMHHIICDGISHEILVRDFMKLYNNEKLEPLPIQYKDFSQWQNNPKEVARLHQQMLYWLKEFAGEIPTLKIPLDYSRPMSQSFQGDSLNFEISKEDTRALNAAALQGGATLFMVLAAAINILLSKLSGQEEIIIGIPIAGRRHSDLEKIIGMFVNTLALRNYPRGELTFIEFLADIKKRVMMVFENQEYPFEKLVDKLSLKRDMGRNPLFDVMFVLQNIDTAPTDVYKETPFETVRPVQPDLPEEYKNITQTAKFDLTFTAAEIERKILFSIQYCTKLFKEETIKRFISYFKKIISQVIENPGLKLKEIEIILEEERHRLLVEFNNAASNYSNNKTIHQLFEEQVEKTPDHIAITLTQIQMSYLQLNEQAHRLGEVLIEKGILANNIVAIMMERSAEMIIGILGILKSGGAYLPINPKNPLKRLNYLLRDSGANLLVVANDLEGEKVRRCEGEKVLLDSIIYPSNHLPYHHSSFLIPHSNIAYIIYTSGSTGNPKGVPISHANICPLLHWGYENLGISPNDRTLQNLSYYFDWSVWEIFITITTGAKLYMVSDEVLLNPADFTPFMKEKDITVLHVTPTQFQHIIRSGHRLETLKYLFLGAEKLSVDLLKRSFAFVKDDCRVFNMYGPTEATIIAAVLETKCDDKYRFENLSNVPIGRPVANGPLLIMDKYLNLCPINAAGELYIGGDGVANGYLNNPELTFEKFIFNRSYRSNKTYILYKTGDLAKWDADGNVEFLGRIDHQVKIRGFRIELEEIECQIQKYDGIKEVLVLAKSEEEEDKDKYLCAYFVANIDIDIKKLRSFLSGRMPDYMIPSYFVRLEKMPLTPNRKVDEKALLKLGLNVSDSYTAPRNEIETKLVALWEEILNASSTLDVQIGIDDNFFALGGHSLKATILASKIQKELNVKLPLAELFKTPTIRGLSEYIKPMVVDIYESIMPVEKKEYYGLSFAQKRMYILQQIDLDSNAYNMPEIIPLAEDVDIERLEESLKKLIKRHESLRTSFHMIRDQPMQKIHREVDFKIEKYEKIAINKFVRSFDLAQAPLLRVGEFKTEDERNYLLVDMHHIISDGVSHQVLKEDFMAFYEGKELPALRLQYKDFAQWQNSPKEIERLHQQISFWLNEFAGEISILEIPIDYPRPLNQSFEGNTFHFEISIEETHALNSLALQSGATQFMILTALINILLSKLSGQEDIIIGTPIAGRRHSDLEKIIGIFVNSLVLRNYPHGDQTFKKFLGDVKERLLLAFENQEYPFEELVDKLPVKRDMGRNPLFDVMFVLQNMEIVLTSPDEKGPFATVGPVQSNLPKEYKNIAPSAKFDLTFTAVEIGRQILFSIQYCTKLFRKETIERFINYFKKIVSIVVKESNIRLSDIEIISEAEKKQILFDFNNTAADYPKDKTIHRLFEEQVEKTPEKVALVGAPGGEEKKRRREEEKNGGVETLRATSPQIQISYRQLNERASRLALLLIEKGVQPNTIVAIMTERSVEMIIGVMGILKSGGAYLPIDPDYPQERIDYMLKDSGAKLLAVANELEGEKVRRWEGEQVLLELNGCTRRGLKGRHRGLQHSNHLCYIIYTSGTTGQPKGSLIEHRNVVRLLVNDKFQFDFSDHDIWTMFHSYCFDFSVWEMYGALLYGGKLLIVTKTMARDTVEFIELLKKEAVTVLNQTPPAFYNLINEDLNSRQTGKKLYIKYVILGGEVLEPLKLKDFRKKYPQTRLINMFGITETTVHVTYKEINETDMELNISNIGKPIPTLSTYILDKYLKPVPVEVMGEIYVGGDGVARGYLNQPELTCEKFKIINYKLKIINGSDVRRTDFHHSILYRSGDLARYLSNGDIEYLGRIDHQVKIRGFRIELGEIEIQLLKYGEIKNAVVLDGGTPDEKYLCAYIVSDTESTLTELRTHLSGKLPEYMIPSYFVQLEKIPLTANGKVDRRALPKPEIKAPLDYLAPRNETETKLTGLWSELLNIQPEAISIDRSFFELGGHSLKATVLASRIHKELNVIIPLGAIFKTPTIRDLSDYIKNVDSNIQRDIDWNLVLMKERLPGLPGDNNLFFLHDGSGEVEGYVEFCNHLTNNFNCWGIRADRLENPAPRNVTIQELAEKYISFMKKVQSHGPYFIAGWSIGGTIAFEMALQLEQRGEPVSFAGLIDVVNPQGTANKNKKGFDLESEVAWLLEYLPVQDKELVKQINQVSHFNEIWPTVIHYLEESKYAVKHVKQAIERDLGPYININDDLSIQQLIYLINRYRSLSHAQSSYFPAGKIQVQIHYFKASDSPELYSHEWENFSREPLHVLEIPGNHFSILKIPNVSHLIKKFNLLT